MRKLLLVIALFISSLAHAELRLPDIMSDNMVLQQSCDAAIWGWAEPDIKISVTVSWNKTRYSAKSDDAGFWKLTVATPAASFEPQSITISEQGGSSQTISNVLIGEVWFCSGQSNMVMPLKGYVNQPVEDAEDAIIYSGKYKGVRVATVYRTEPLTPQEVASGKWKCSEPANAADFSATAYYFATTVSEIMNTPVGVIVSAWGGSSVQGWMSEKLLESKGYNDVMDRASNKKLRNARPMIMYNGMLYPLRHYTIKGYTWYQGCSDVADYAKYADLQATMVNHWRELWGQGELPFYFVEIAPHTYRDDFGAPRLREAQSNSVELISNSGMVSTADLVYPYERGCIHPRQKKEIGERLARLAMEKTYGIKGMRSEAPRYKSMEKQQDGSVSLSFTNADKGFSFKGSIRGFEVAGEDRVFYPATAKIENREPIRIQLSCAEVEDIVAVRYCFYSFEPVALWNSYGQPLVPFRTDNWD